MIRKYINNKDFTPEETLAAVNAILNIKNKYVK